MMGVLLAIAVIGAGVALGRGEFGLAAGIIGGWWVLAWLMKPSAQPYRPPQESTPPINPAVKDPTVRKCYGLPPLADPTRDTRTTAPTPRSEPGPMDLNEILHSRRR